jgi:benzoyl-CoA reductase/2-hydroxyglutaryl-CoA dehydratase subunit BcrC/BadD/HgdB
LLVDFKNNINSSLIRKIVKKPNTYNLIKAGSKIYFRKGSKSFKMWLDFLFYQLKEACKKRKLVVWTNIYTPSELLYSLDLIPIYPELISGVSASVGLANYFIETAESKFYTSDLCSFYRVAAGFTLRDYLPKPDLIISSSQLCDGSTKFFHNISKYYDCEHYLIDPPYYNNPDIKGYLAGQLEEISYKICNSFGYQLDNEQINFSFNLSNKTREYIIKLNEFRKNIPSPLSGWDAMAYILYMFFSSLGTKKGVEFYRTLYQEIEEKVNQKMGVLDEEKYRILWLHQIRPYYKNEIIQNLKEKEAVISFEEVSYVYWEALDPQKPWESLAQKINSNFGAGPIERRIKVIYDLVKRYKIDGVIHFSQRGCRQSCGGAYIIKDFLKQKGVPMLILDGDGADSHNYSKGQTRTRIEAFLEMLS